jgi:N utilization substance protein B
MKSDDAIDLAFQQEPRDAQTLAFARDLVEGVVKQGARIDAAIEKHAREWTLERMANIDRNVLRLAICELLFMPDIPPSVTVDEAVELAKKYSTAESGRFVNGILGNLVRHLDEELAEQQVE